MRMPLFAVACLAAIIMASNAFAAQKPGPSADLYNSPYYKCVQNYYVSSIGNDSQTGTSLATAWKTLQHANNAKRSAGDCVNVEPGTYAGVQLTGGGNLASSTGYVVYRCSVLDACIITATAGVNGNAEFFASGTGSANYVIIDGFKIVGNGTIYNVGVEITGSLNGTVGTFSSHHDWVFNSFIYDNGQAGVALAEGDYTYVIHNTIYKNASAPNCDNGAQGSGLADNVPLDILRGYPAYMPTPDDKTNPNPLIGSFVTGTTWFHKAYMWNVVFSNNLKPCNGGAKADTDGNNIILDTFGTLNGNVVTYPDQTLIAYNVVFNSGGGGIHIFASEYATIANNTVYNAYLDTNDQAANRAGIDTTNSYGNTIINNISVAVPVAPKLVCAFSVSPYGQFNSAMLGGPPVGKPADYWSHNITELAGSQKSCWGAFNVDAPNGENPMFQSDVYSCSSNKCRTDPKWMNVISRAAGTFFNFSLNPGSPAIGYGLTATFLPSTSVDVGACSRTLVTCP